MKRNVEIDDTLQERVDDAIEQVRETIDERWEKEERELLTSREAFEKLEYDGRIHEIVDGSVPVYTKEIEDVWYCHKNELLEAYENAGIGTNPHANDGMVSIFCYIYEKVMGWMNLEEWQDED